MSLAIFMSDILKRRHERWDSRSIFHSNLTQFFKVDFTPETREFSEAFECRLCSLSLLILLVSLDLSFLIFWVWPKMRYPLTPSFSLLSISMLFRRQRIFFFFLFYSIFLGKCFLSHKTANLMFVLWNSNSFGKALHLNVLWVHFMFPNAKTFLLFYSLYFYFFVCVFASRKRRAMLVVIKKYHSEVELRFSHRQLYQKHWEKKVFISTRYQVKI